MGYSKCFSIIDGVALPRFSRDDFDLLLDDFMQNYPNAPIISECADYHNIENKEVNTDYLCEYLSDSGYIIDDEFLDNVYLGKSVYEISEDSNSNARAISTLPDFPTIDSAIFDLIQKMFPKYHINRYLVNWVL